MCPLTGAGYRRGWFWDGSRWVERRQRRTSDAPLVATIIVGSAVLVVATFMGLWLMKPLQSQELKTCIAGYRSELAQQREFPQATVQDYCRALYG